MVIAMENNCFIDGEIILSMFIYKWPMFHSKLLVIARGPLPHFEQWGSMLNLRNVIEP